MTAGLRCLGGWPEAGGWGIYEELKALTPSVTDVMVRTASRMPYWPERQEEALAAVLFAARKKNQKKLDGGAASIYTSFLRDIALFSPVAQLAERVTVNH